MECQDIRYLMDRSLDAEMTASEAEAFYRHIANCPECAEEFSQLGKLMKHMRSSSAPLPADSQWDDIWHNVRSRTLSQRSRRQLHLSFRTRLAAVAAVLAIIGVTAGILFLGNRSDEAMQMSEASSRHGMVQMAQPCSDPGLALLTVSEGTLASYETRNDSSN